MAVITPNTDVILLKVPLEISDDHQLTFANATAQFNYFNGLSGKIELENFTYSRKDGVLRVPYGYDAVISYNYVMYRNTSYSNKWFYAFITGYEYLNDGATALSIKTDVWQTYQFDLTYKKCFVEREHVNDDTFGLHTYPETLEVGEYVRGSSSGISYNYNNEYWLAFQVTELISNMTDGQTGGRTYNGLYNGLIVVLVDDYRTADLFIAAYDDAGKREAIVSAFYIPKAMEPDPQWCRNVVLHNVTCDVAFPKERGGAIGLATLSMNRPTTLDGYTPKNNKMFTKEFCYIYATNYCGATATYAFEDFRDIYGVTQSSATFNVDGVLCQGCSIKIYPSNGYKFGTNGYLYGKGGWGYGLVAAKLPMVSWNSDYYTNWVTQNAMNFKVDPVSNIFTGLVHGGVVGAIANAFSTTTDLMKQQYAAQLVPNQASGDLSAGDVNFSSMMVFNAFAMTVKAEYAKKCDDYLSTYGYRIHEVKLPNITGRRNWNFVKTVGCYITADIPQEDLQEIKSLFDKGITFWHNPATFMDYSQTNDII